MNKIALATAFVMTTAASGSFAATFDDPFSSFVAFGDSLVDDGKFGSLSPPSLRGRLSNGITYAEHIANDFLSDSKLALNFALGGATAEADNETDYGPFAAVAAPLATFANQIQTFAATTIGAPLGSTPLFSVLMGGNDILQDIGETPTVGADAANAVKAGIEAIGALDPSYRSFVVANLADPALTPRFQGSPFASVATAVTAQFNAQLAQNAQMLRDIGYTIFELDLNVVMQDVFDNAASLGITNTTDACTPSLFVFDPFDNCAVDPATFDVDIALADSFFFVDDVHPNRVVHNEIASAFRGELAVAPVPLPASLGFLLGGLGFLSVMRKRS